MKMFKRAETKSANKKWMIAFTDGDDNSSEDDYIELTEKLAKSGINLIIIGITLEK
jgi:Mg-chelatase subunit ChlD